MLGRAALARCAGLLLLVAVLVVVPGSASHGGRLADCPGFCECSTWFRLARASCTGRSLYSIHTGVSNVVQALDLSNNSIYKLEDRQLSRAGLTRLKYLNLSMNAISEIGPNAFEDLKNLTVLDLSMNRIDYISPNTFYENQNLKILNLAGNKFNLHVPQLLSITLTELNLSTCGINSLLKDAFEGLKRLRKLDLSNNNLMELDKEVLRAMPFLRSLSLAKNFWSCNGAMHNLKMYLRTTNIRTDSICEKLGPTSPKGVEMSAKMVSLKTISEPEKLPEPRISKDLWEMESWRELEEAVEQQEQQEQQDRPVTDSDPDSPIDTFSSALNGVSPFWFLLTGFLLGSGATIVVTYLWLSTTISCLIPRIRRAEAAENADTSSQRISLLRHLWHQENMGSVEENSIGGGSGGNASQMFVPGSPSCPGTPPPPYREVMLHRNLYPRAAMVAAAQHQSGRLFISLPAGDSTRSGAYNI